MGISNHKSLYKSEFFGLQFWGPSSKQVGKVTGFDTKSIDRPIGQLFGKRDIKIFETLFWPFSKQFGYSDWDERIFRDNLKLIRPWLDEPLEFECVLYERLNDKSAPIRELSAYKTLHNRLIHVWTLLKKDGCFPGMMKPFKISHT